MACTQSVVTCLTSFRGNLLGWAQDTGHNWETLRITLVIPEKRSRYLKHCGLVPDEHFPIISEKGIAIRLKQSHKDASALLVTCYSFLIQQVHQDSHPILL
jgi:hypothetical protein